MTLHPTVEAVTARIKARSATPRAEYMDRCRRAAEVEPGRPHLSCGNIAHAAAAAGTDKAGVAGGRAPNIGIVTAYNDMLSAHQPFERFPDIIKQTARASGATAQVAGGVPSMCDGVTQGRPGMELSLFSRDVIAMSAGIGLSHDVFDAAIFLGVCDKIVPGLIMAAAAFGHLPTAFLPAGPMPSGIGNDEKSAIRQAFARGEIGREELLKAEMASYHGPGTCTFYGTANTNQMLMEFMGLHLPGASFVNPNTPLRDALTVAGTRRVLEITRTGDYTPVCEVLSPEAFVNGIVGLHATGGSTNLLIHLIAMARAAGVILDWEDFSDLSAVAPLMAKVYPNGLADVNHFHAAGGLGYMIGELLAAGLLHEDVKTLNGTGLSGYTAEPKLAADGSVAWEAGAGETLNDKILRPVADPFQPTGGLQLLTGNLGSACIKVSAVAPERRVVEAPCRIFHDQESVKTAFRAGELTGDVVVVVRFQGPRANGMPELHGLTPTLSVMQDRGQKVALVTDGRMSGASGKVPAAIHVSPEAETGGPIAKLRDGDILRVDAEAGVLEALVPADAWAAREDATADLSANGVGMGRELFAALRAAVGTAETGASAAI
ncbi:phosphogluconate dehydratase [Rhodovulum sp. DZ06]|uniref:phosphogluconate dehydratase n=1 Tax=Rhodovulum sp. DZ06 TaxID=3425126 RepID=UPI003D346D4E